MEGADRARPCRHRRRHADGQDDQTLVPLPEGATYLGFIFARRRAVRVESALRALRTRVSIRDGSAIPGV
jgi:hypothetical protein